MSRATALVCLAALVSTASIANQPEAELTDRVITGLSETQREGYVAGQGMGMAIVAERNGYPGPRHVLDLTEELNLSADQLDQTRDLFQSMQTKAQELGAKLVNMERRLDNLFASGDVRPENVRELTRQIGELKGRLRNAHLETHIAQNGILTETQNEEYQKLRGRNQERGHREHMND